MLRTWPLVVGLVAGLVGTAGCESENGDGEASADPPASFSDDPLEAAIQRRARKRTPHMTPEGDLQKGRLGERKSTDLAVVLKPPHCYALFATGPSTGDLDMFLFDPGGSPIQQDSTGDASPVLGVAEPLCPAQAGLYRVRLSMVEGHGSYAFQVYQSE